MDLRPARPRLPALLLALVVLPACPILTRDNYLENRPPRLVEELSRPEGYEVRVRAEEGCAPLEFSARVDDPDLDDDIRYRWFVDDVLVADGVVRNTDLEQLRAVPLSWSEIPRVPDSPLREPGTHVVELIAADAEILGREPQPRRPRPDGGGDPTYADSRAWVVTVEPGPPCP
ncbi:hypothetical protein [Pyxidicoccus xibeiensis]|uniref:hypothetical protein n=1 Tax=Pyxidicoccus xibeiensis TaxID=2906759 RepID=UPI0020A7C448|nr:hypothetical protein [Pyxidicoccus xibeiensis]MCP3143811.1 hypothetical protein [Pyxidicoccus xibeiensis]